MPSVIHERDFVQGRPFSGGWLDLQAVLQGILYQGGLAIHPVQRLAEIADQVQALLKQDADDSLFCLFQALADKRLGYCATHALLCAAVGELTADKLGLDPTQRQSLLCAALVMNIGMDREQDRLSRQRSALTPEQRSLIKTHPQKSAAILAAFGLDDADQLDIVRWHHEPEAPQALPGNLMARRILCMADGFVARMAARKTRAAMSSLDAVKSIYRQAEGQASPVAAAMVAVVGFYPPGTYVQLANGDMAVSVQRAQKANTPWVIRLADKQGMPLLNGACQDTEQLAYAISNPVNAEKIRVMLSVEKVRRARAKMTN